MSDFIQEVSDGVVGFFKTIAVPAVVMVTMLSIVFIGVYVLAYPIESRSLKMYNESMGTNHNYNGWFFCGSTIKDIDGRTIVIKEKK